MKVIHCRAVTVLAICFLLTGCKTTPEKEKADPAAQTKPPKPPNIADQSADTSFQAFLTVLRGAIKNHDTQTIAPMMTKTFGYRLEPLGEGEGVFAYWDQNNIWPELQLVMNEAFVPNGNYMVAPAEFAKPGSTYNGYRAGLVRENGSWRFAYFVSGE